MATNYLTRSPGTPTSEKIATMSCWVKVNDTAGSIGLFAQTASSSGNGVMFFINASSQLEFYATNGSSQAARVVTNRLLRDGSGWYLLQCHIDTTQGTSADRVKLYVNGSQETSLSTASYPTQNINLNGFDGSGNQIFGSLDNLSYDCKADIADAYFIDGSIIASNQFWETDATTGQIKPKLDPTIGSFGTNGYHLKFENANAGIDSKPSGASNFSTTGTIRQQVDTPSNVFATFNRLTRHGQNTNNNGDLLENGNTVFDTPSSTDSMKGFVLSTLGMDSGKYYCEIKVKAGIRLGVGICNMNVFNTTSVPYDTTNQSMILYTPNDGNIKYDSDSTYATSVTAPENTILGFALDMDNNHWYIHKNGTYINSGDPTSGSTGTGSIIGNITNGTNYFNHGEMFFFASDFSTTGYARAEFNFGNGYFASTAISSEGTNASGNGKFEYDVPTGYTALSTKGLNE